MTRPRDQTAKEMRNAMLQLRHQSGLTQPVFASAVGVSSKTVSRWECGERRPTRAQAIDVITVLRPKEGVDHRWLAELAVLAGLDPLAQGLNLRDGDEDDEAAAVVPPPAPPPPPPPPRPAPADVRTRVDLALLATAEELDVSPRGLRQGLRGVLEAVESCGYSVAELRALM